MDPLTLWSILPGRVITWTGSAINPRRGWGSSSDILRGMQRAEPWANDELQMRAFWRRWHALVQQPRPTPDLVRPVEV